MRLVALYKCYMSLPLHREVPLSEIREVSRYLADVFSCNTDSLPTDFLLHSYWTLMPRQFATVGAYSRCLRVRTGALATRTCQRINPYYCGRRFGDQGSIGRLAVCRELLAGADMVNYSVPSVVTQKAKKYIACLRRSRSLVAI